ncbi:MAG: RidA family protein [Phycisphaerales bacterium JB038]
MQIKRTHSHAPWEQEVGYCRAVRFGDQVYVTGTAPVADDGSTFAPGDAYAQARRCFELIMAALDSLTGDIETPLVLRTRMFVTDIKRWQEYGKAHAEFFQDAPPATTMVEVKSLISPDMLIEVEADALFLPTP